jgi:uncharacterized UBP type Zn finger protein
MVATRGLPLPCAHLEAQPLTPLPAGFEPYCADCALTGDQWVNLRRCLTCDRLGCCDDSPSRHATRHFATTGHPVMTSAEPGETWRWCFIDKEAA